MSVNASPGSDESSPKTPSMIPRTEKRTTERVMTTKRISRRRRLRSHMYAPWSSIRSTGCPATGAATVAAAGGSSTSGRLRQGLGGGGGAASCEATIPTTRPLAKTKRPTRALTLFTPDDLTVEKGQGEGEELPLAAARADLDGVRVHRQRARRSAAQIRKRDRVDLALAGLGLAELHRAADDIGLRRERDERLGLL